MNKVPITLKGIEKLRQELKHLKSVRRPQIVQAIAEARAHGDLKENAEYHAAKEEQGFTEGRIKDIDGKLSNAEVIDVASLGDVRRIVFGATLELYDEDEEKEVHYQIVGEDEADVKERMISITSPLARALIGKEEGDVVEFAAPGGRKTYEVIRITYI